MMIQVTATDLKTNLGKYLNLASKEEISITKNGEEIAVLIPPKPRKSWVDDLIGVIPSADIDAKQLKAERLAQKHESTN